MSPCRALVVELLCVFAAILKRNPELDFSGELSCDALIGEAVAVFKKVWWGMVLFQATGYTVQYVNLGPRDPL